MSDGDDSADVRDLSEERRRRARAGTRVETIGLYELDRELRMLPPNNPVFRNMPAGKWREAPGGVRADGLPDGCPVVPLGYEDHQYWFLSARGTLFALSENGGKGNIMSLFTPYPNFLAWAWPRFVNTNPKKGAGEKPIWEVKKGNFEAEEAKADLMKACADVGPYDPLQKVRGRGAWIDEMTGQLILHLGDRLVTPDGERPCGIYGGKAYPRGPALPAPAEHDAMLGDELPGMRILHDLLTWNWSRGELDARLMLGWLALARMGGALRWRPYVYATGDAGSGKTTLQTLATAVLGGEEALLRPVDVTEAAVSQVLGQDSIPVLLDEQEHEADNNRARKMIAMARLAASGGQRWRGGADGVPTGTRIQAPFMFAGIDMPTASDADMTRMAVLGVAPVPQGTVRGDPPNLYRLGQDGLGLFKQMVDWFQPNRSYQGLPRFEEVLDMFREGLRDHAGHSDRGMDTFGYLMAGYWCATEVRVPQPDEVRELVEPLHVGSLAEYENVMAGWRKCFHYMLDAQPRALERQSRQSVRAILESYRNGESVDLYTDGQQTSDALASVQKSLGRVGLTIKFEKGATKCWDNAWLFVPNVCPPLADLFQGERWAPSSKSEAGGWVNALRGGDDKSDASPIKQDKMNGGTRRGTSLRLAVLLPEHKD